MIKRILSSLVVTIAIVNNGLSIEPKPIYIAQIITEGAKTAKTNPLSLEHTYMLGFNQLTPNGHRMMHTLGRQTLENYKDFFSGQADIHEFNLFSDNSPPAESSLRSFFIGVAPHFKHSNLTGEWTDGLLPHFDGISSTDESDSALIGLAKPYPINKVSLNQDLMFMDDTYESCPRASKHLLHDSKGFMMKLTEAVAPIGQSLNSQGVTAKKIFGKEYWTPFLLSELYDVLTAYYFETGLMINGVEDGLLHELRYIKSLYYTSEFFTTNQESRLHTHGIFSQIMEDLSNRVFDGDSKIKYTVFSAKARTLLAFLVVLQLSSFDCLLKGMVTDTFSNDCKGFPEYGSTLIFEASAGEDKSNLYFRLILNGITISLDRLGLQQTKYTGFYKLGETIDLLEEKFTMDNFKEFCGNEIISDWWVDFYKDYIPYEYLIKLSLIILNIGIFFLTFIVYCWITCRIKKEAKMLFSDLQVEGYPREAEQEDPHVTIGGVMLTTERGELHHSADMHFDDTHDEEKHQASDFETEGHYPNEDVEGTIKQKKGIDED